MEWQLVVSGRIADLKQKKILIEDLLASVDSEREKKKLQKEIKSTEKLIETNEQFLMNFNYGEMQ
jgi:uncharacterized protein YeeX (DUF496 family)